MVSAETSPDGPPPAGRSNRSISNTSLPSACVSATVATFSPARRASSIATNSAFTMEYVSGFELNFAISRRAPSLSSAFGRAPPIELP